MISGYAKTFTGDKDFLSLHALTDYQYSIFYTLERLLEAQIHVWDDLEMSAQALRHDMSKRNPFIGLLPVSYGGLLSCVSVSRKITEFLDQVLLQH